MARSWSANSVRTLGLLLALAMVVAACGTGAPEGGGGTEDTTGTTPAAGGVPRPGLMVATWDDEPVTLDPAAVSPQDVSRGLIFNVYERLFDIPADSPELVPGLASEIPTLENGGISEDGLTYTFRLREGVTFHDGTEFTAEDVQYSWSRVLDMGLPEGQSDLLSNISEMNVVDDHTLEVVLDQVDVNFLHILASEVASIVSSEAVEANGGVTEGQPNEWMAQNMVGTGPYTFTEWNRGESIEFAVYDDYWGEPATLDVRGLNVKEPSAGAAAGEYDVLSLVPTDVPKLEGIEGIVINTDYGSTQLLEIGFNMNIDTSIQPDGDDVPTDFFQDVRIRQAFNYAFPYQDYIDGVLEGLGKRGSWILPQEMEGYDPNAPIYEHDPARAEELFREAGVWDTGFTVSILTDQTHDGFTGAALAMKDGIESLNPNFNVNVLGVPEARFDEMIATQPLPVAMWSYTTPELLSPLDYFLNSAHPDGPWGSLASFADGYSDPDRVVSLIDEARQELDADRRLEIYLELQELLYEEAPWVLPAQEIQPFAYGEWMQGVVMNPRWPRPYMKWALYSK